MRRKISKTKTKKVSQKKRPKRALTRTTFSKLAKPIGKVTHYYRAIGVGIVKFKKPVRAGTNVEFRGATTNFTQVLASMQYNHESLKIAPKGKKVGVKVKKRVREGDEVFEVK